MILPLDLFIALEDHVGAGLLRVALLLARNHQRELAQRRECIDPPHAAFHTDLSDVDRFASRRSRPGDVAIVLDTRKNNAELIVAIVGQYDANHGLPAAGECRNGAQTNALTAAGGGKQDYGHQDHCHKDEASYGHFASTKLIASV